MIINSHVQTIKQKNKNNLKSFKTLKRTKKLKKNLHQNPVDTKLYPRSFPKIHNYFGVCGHNSVSTH